MDPLTETTAHRIALALERIATRLERDAVTFDEMVKDGRTLAVLSDEERKAAILK